MRLRRLNDAGVRCFGEFLDSLTTDTPIPRPEGILINSATSEPVEPGIEIEEVIFTNRYEAGRYLNEQFGDAGIPDLERDQELWSWLALFYFEQLCPSDEEGRHRPGERARWIPAIGDFRKYYRHLLAGPYRIYRTHRDNPERAMILLGGPLHSPGEIVEQLAANQELVTNKAVVECATRLYYDSSRQNRHFKVGAAGKGAGSARRFVDVLNQFDMTWDLYSMTTDEVLAMLPDEFEKFRPAGTPSQ